MEHPGSVGAVTTPPPRAIPAMTPARPARLANQPGNCDYLRPALWLARYPALWLDMLTCGSAWWTVSTNQHIGLRRVALCVCSDFAGARFVCHVRDDAARKLRWLVVLRMLCPCRAAGRVAVAVGRRAVQMKVVPLAWCAFR